MRTTKRKSARIARRLFRLCLVGGQLDESRVRLVVRRAVAAHRLAAAPVLVRFLRLVRIDRDRHTARVESAVPLADDLRARLEADVTRRFGQATATEFSENPQLIGGIRVRVGSQVYDDSVRGRLAAIEARL